MDNQSALQPQSQALPEGKLSPFAVKQITLSQQAYIQLKWDAKFWQTQHKRACEREAALKQELQQKEAMIRDLKRRLFGKKSEQGVGKSEQSPDGSPASQQPKRPRGHQPGKPGHGRTERPELPVVEEVIELNEQCCPQCGLDYLVFPGDEESEIVELGVRAYKRVIKRKRAKKACCCNSTPRMITAPVAPRVIPKSPYGSSVWEQILLGKYRYAQSIHGLLQDLSSHGLTLAQGTITGGLKKLNPLFAPIYQGIYQKQMTEKLFHNDESRWEVYEEVEGKIGHRWYLWVTQSKSAIYYCIDPTRSTSVPLQHFSELTSGRVIVVCDRYSAYKKLARLNSLIILAFCWAHVRRDFLELARNHPDLTDWGLEWVREIGRLYHLNNLRLERWQPEQLLAQQSTEFQARHQALQTQLDTMKSRCDALLQADAAPSQPGKPAQKLEVVQRKVLTSLQNHWIGLNVFLDQPYVPMDNNTAERAIRGPVTGRKNYYGSGSIWSSEQAAMMFTIFQTMALWQLNERTWLRSYLDCCAQNGGRAPEDVSDFLPWLMSDTRRQQLSKPPMSLKPSGPKHSRCSWGRP